MHVAVLQDLPGPKVRTGPLADGAPSVLLANGAPFILTTDAVSGTAAASASPMPDSPRRGSGQAHLSRPTARSRCASNRSMGTMSTRASKAAAHCGDARDQLPRRNARARCGHRSRLSNISPSVSTPTSTGSPSRSSAAPPIFCACARSWTNAANASDHGQDREAEALEDIDAIVLAATASWSPGGDLGVEILLEEVR